MKHCNECNTTKRNTDFSRRKANEDKLDNRCKDCCIKAKNELKQKQETIYDGQYSGLKGFTKEEIRKLFFEDLY